MCQLEKADVVRWVLGVAYRQVKPLNRRQILHHRPQASEPFCARFRCEAKAPLPVKKLAAPVLVSSRSRVTRCASQVTSERLQQDSRERTRIKLEEVSACGFHPTFLEPPLKSSSFRVPRSSRSWHCCANDSESNRVPSWQSSMLSFVQK
mmetsp:Transcript_8633/g.27542  ORF Transcript_8633/g.27542 Transcript_8633/m.27542 type:complete len:150 (-) Transcript_8633:79-528(-)